MKPKQVVAEIQELTQKLISKGLCDDQNFPSLRKHALNSTVVDFGKIDFSIALKNVSYDKIYKALLSSRAYNIKMLDGALLQLSYNFSKTCIESHRLCFLPCPHLEHYQDHPWLYDTDNVYSDIVDKKKVPFPIRFDFNQDDSIFIDVRHPKSHLTLGQYADCRIPVSGPVTPKTFLLFILRHFYNTAENQHSAILGVPHNIFRESISTEERKVTHIKLHA